MNLFIMSDRENTDLFNWCGVNHEYFRQFRIPFDNESIEVAYIDEHITRIRLKRIYQDNVFKAEYFIESTKVGISFIEINNAISIKPIDAEFFDSDYDAILRSQLVAELTTAATYICYYYTYHSENHKVKTITISDSDGDDMKYTGYFIKNKIKVANERERIIDMNRLDYASFK